MLKLCSIFLIIFIFLNSFFQTGCTNQHNFNGNVKILFCGQYLSDANSDTVDVIKQFEQQTKIKVSAYSTFESNEQLYAKLKHGKFEYDVILPSDYMIERLIKENMLKKINKNLIENYDKIKPIFKGKNCGFDETEEFSVPYTFGRIGLIYNENLIQKLLPNENLEELIFDFKCLFNEKLKKQILMFASSKDSFAIAQKILNNSINTTNFQQIQQAAILLKNQKRLVQAYVNDEIFDKIINNEAAIAPAYSGDIINMMAENKNLKCCFPKTGTIMFIDAMCIPANAKNVENAHQFINFMCKPEIAAENCKFSSFSSTIEDVENLLELPAFVKKIAYPDLNELNLCETQKFLNEPIESHIAKLWEQLKL